MEHKEEKKPYVAPEVDVITWGGGDIIRTSGESERGVKWNDNWGTNVFDDIFDTYVD